MLWYEYGDFFYQNTSKKLWKNFSCKQWQGAIAHLVDNLKKYCKFNEYFHVCSWISCICISTGVGLPFSQSRNSRKATIATTTEYEVQRIETNLNESEQIQNSLLRMCKDRCYSPWHHNRFEHFKTFIAPPPTLAVSAKRNDFCEPELTATDHHVPGNFSVNPDSSQLAEKSWSCDLSLMCSDIKRYVFVWPREVLISCSNLYQQHKK